MSEHTPEPWEAVRNTAYWEIGTEIDGYYANRIGDVCATDPNNPDSGKQEANARRIVACVNACAGMEDPAAEIARLREEVKRWKAEAMAWRNMPHLDHIRGSYWEEEDMKALDAARATNEIKPNPLGTLAMTDRADMTEPVRIIHVNEANERGEP